MLEHDLPGKRSLEQIAYGAGLHQLVNDSVKNVAANLGYCDAFAFSAQFKAYIGISPSIFQQRAGAKNHMHPGHTTRTQ